MGETERAVYVQRIDPEQQTEYVEAHEDVPPGVADAMERSGVEEFETYVRGDIALCILEIEDVDDYVETMNGDEAVEEWERYVSQFKRDGVDVDADEPVPFMKRIWSLADERT